MITYLYLCLAAYQVFTEFLPIKAGPDNRGSEFIIGFMENKQLKNEISKNPELYITTMKTTIVNVQVKAPLYTTSTIDETFSVTAGVVEKISFNSDIRVTGTTLTNKGIWIKANDEIVIYGVNPEKLSNDAFLGLPIDVLGTEYYVITWWPAKLQCELLVIGVHDSTTVHIKLSEALESSKVTWNGTDYYKDDTITTTINRYETLQLTSDGDLTGSYITSDYIVSVFSGNRKTNIGTGSSSDHLVEQWPPVSTFGKTFATVPIPGRTIGDMFKFVASEDNTQVNITASNYFTSFTLSLAGSHEEKDIQSDYYSYVKADKPILVAQFCKSQTSSTEKSDPMMVMIPPIELYAADYTFTTPKYGGSGSYTNYFMFVVKDSEKTGLLVDGSAFNASTVYNSILGTDLVGGYIEVSEGTHQVRHTSTISVFGGYLFGTANFETYGFPTGSRFAPINTVCVASATVIGDGIDNDCDGLIDEELCSNGQDDDGDGLTDEDCATPSPVNGNWTEWTVWSSCSITCTGNGSLVSGLMTRTRTCTNPTPQYDGEQCSGNKNETTSCSTSAECRETTTTDDTTSTETTTVTTTTDTTTVTHESTTVTSTADTTAADDTETTFTSTSKTTSVGTSQTYMSAETVEKSTETTTADDTTSPKITTITTTAEITTVIDESTTVIPTEDTTAADDIETKLTSTSTRTSPLATSQSDTSSETVGKATEALTSIVLSGIVAATIIGPCCALCLLLALRRRLRKFKREVKPKEAFKDDFSELYRGSDESTIDMNYATYKPDSKFVRHQLEF